MVSLSFTAESKTQRTSGIDSHAAEGSKGDADCTLAWREQLPKGSQIKRGLQVYPLHYPCHCYYVPRVLQQFVSASTTTAAAAATTTTTTAAAATATTTTATATAATTTTTTTTYYYSCCCCCRYCYYSYARYTTCYPGMACSHVMAGYWDCDAISKH